MDLRPSYTIKEFTVDLMRGGHSNFYDLQCLGLGPRVTALPPSGKKKIIRGIHAAEWFDFVDSLNALLAEAGLDLAAFDKMPEAERAKIIKRAKDAAKAAE